MEEFITQITPDPQLDSPPEPLPSSWLENHWRHIVTLMTAAAILAFPPTYVDFRCSTYLPSAESCMSPGETIIISNIPVLALITFVLINRLSHINNFN